MARTDTVQAHKDAATHFLQLLVTGHIEEGYREHVDMSGKHHNVYFPAGFPALQKAMLENQVKYPMKQFTTKHVLGDGDMVATHSRVVLEQGGMEMEVMHIFRFVGERIVEMWDFAQPVPADSPNKDGAF